MANELYKIESVVMRVLKRNPDTRGDNFLLIAEVYREMCEGDPLNDISGYSFYEVMRKHKRFHLPAFESITRARRKIQEKNYELRPDADVQKVRSEQELKFLEYAHEVS